MTVFHVSPLVEQMPIQYCYAESVRARCTDLEGNPKKPHKQRQNAFHEPLKAIQNGGPCLWMKVFFSCTNTSHMQFCVSLLAIKTCGCVIINADFKRTVFEQSWVDIDQVEKWYFRLWPIISRNILIALLKIKNINTPIKKLKIAEKPSSEPTQAESEYTLYSRIYFWKPLTQTASLLTEYNHFAVVGCFIRLIYKPSCLLSGDCLL